MNRPIAGPAPLQVAEVTSATVWPTIGATPLGRLVGKMAGNRTGMGFFTLGKVLAILAIPAALAAYAWKVLPPGVRRYRLTNRRIVIQKGLRPRDDLSVGLGEFDAINVVVLPGQEFLAGELVFRRDGREVFRLSAVRSPHVLREVCIEARMAFTAVQEVLDRQSDKGSAAARLVGCDPQDSSYPTVETASSGRSE